jgi:hypothetical protein
MSCQLTATTAAVQLAKRIGATALATGFAGYQRGWIEQSIEAEVILRRALELDGLRLELPAATLSSKETAISALAALSLTMEPLEQKCVTQQFNPELSEQELLDQAGRAIELAEDRDGGQEEQDDDGFHHECTRSDSTS